MRKGMARRSLKEADVEPDDSHFISGRDWGRLETKVDNILLHQAEARVRYEKLENSISTTNEKVDERFKVLENKLHWYSGGIAAVVAMLTVFGDAVKRFFA